MSVEFENFEKLLQAAKDLPAMPITVIDADELHVVEGACEGCRGRVYRSYSDRG